MKGIRAQIYGAQGMQLYTVSPDEPDSSWSDTLPTMKGLERHWLLAAKEHHGSGN